MEFRILGSFEARSDDGDVVAVSGAKERAVLAFLLLHAGRVVPVDRLIDELWGEDPPESARKSVQVRVAGLRKALGPECVTTRPSGYLVRLDRDTLDLERFQQLVAASAAADPGEAASLLDQALELWRGPALADFRDEPWAAPATARLEELRLVAIEKRVDAYLDLGRHEEVAADLPVLVSEHPLRERLRAQLMLALYRSGRQADALDAYQSTRRVMVDELGIEPGPVLVELERAVLRQDPSLELEQPVQPERSILVAAFEEETVDALLALAGPLARRPRRELILVRPNVQRADLPEVGRHLEALAEAPRAAGIVVRSAVFTSVSPGRHVVRIAAEQDVDLLLVDAPAGLLDESELAEVLASAPCDVAVLAGGGEPESGPVLVPFSGAEHDWSAIEVAAWLASVSGDRLQLVGPAGETGDASRLLADASLAVQRASGVAVEPLILEPGPDELLRAAARAGLVVSGLSDRWRTEGLGPVRSALVAGSTPVLLVRRGLRPGGLAPPESYTRFTWTILPS